MRKLTTVLLLATQVIVGGCATLQGSNSRILRRYATQTRIRETAPTVKITVFALPVPSTPPAATEITNLANDAQAELVKAMAGRTQGSPAGLVQALAMPIEGTSSEPSFHDRTRFARRLVFSLENQSPGPANRISEARIYVHPLNGTRFVSWNRIENDYQTVDLGKLNLSQERGSNVGLGLTLPVASASPSVSASASSTLQEEMVLQQRRTQLTGAITPDTAMLLQQGGFGIDLTGNVTADFDLVVPGVRDTTVFIPSVPDACGEEPVLRRQTIRYPDPRTVNGRLAELDTVWMDVQLNYVLRDVRRGDRTLVEGDDDVVFREGTARIDRVAVIPGEMLKAAVFELRMNDATVIIEGATQSGTSERRVPFQFAHFEDAAAMLAWLRRCGVDSLHHPLLVSRQRLNGDDAMRLNIWRVPLNYPGLDAVPLAPLTLETPRQGQVSRARSLLRSSGLGLRAR